MTDALPITSNYAEIIRPYDTGGKLALSGVTRPFYVPADPVLTTTPLSTPLKFPSGVFIPSFTFLVSPQCGAEVSVVLTQSTDGGSTFAPVTDEGAPLLSTRRSGRQDSVSVLQQKDTLYRVEYMFSDPGGRYVDFVYRIERGSNGAGFADGSYLAHPFSIPFDYDVAAVRQSPLQWIDPFGTPAQYQKFIDTIRTPLTNAAISGPLTAYKACTYGTIAPDGTFTSTGIAVAKLSIPAAAKRARIKRLVVGFDRCIRAEYADVDLVVKEDGTAVGAGYSIIDPPAKNYAGTIYVPGSRVTAKDLSGSPKNNTLRDELPMSTGAFNDPTYFAGIACYTTLIEAARLSYPPMTWWRPDLTALGL